MERNRAKPRYAGAARGRASVGPDRNADFPGYGGRALRNERHRDRRRAAGPWHWALIPLAVFAFVSAARAGGPETLEYAVKATFVYKFAPFVTWPGAGLGQGPFPICVSGDDNVAPLIASAVRGQQIDRRPIAVRQVTSEDGLEGCAILYDGAPGTRAGRRLLEAARGKPILTITDGGDGPHGIIAFHILDGRVRFDIDQGLAADAGLDISSKLLSLAHSVTPGPRP